MDLVMSYCFAYFSRKETYRAVGSFVCSVSAQHIVVAS